MRGQRVDTKACAVFILKIVDVLECYNVHREEYKLQNKSFPGNVHVFKLPELFALFGLAFGRLKDEKDLLIDRIKARKGLCSDGHRIKLNEMDGVID